jgi:type IV pilus assembly protein PilP
MIRTTIVLITLAGLIACGETRPPAPAPHIVKQKISVQSVASADAAANAEKASKPAPEPQGLESAVSPVPQARELEEENGSDLVAQSLQIANGYNPEGRFDPFEPLFKEEPDAPIVDEEKGKRKKRIPQTPLERIALSQLKLSAIIRAASGNRGLVEDATGKGYVVEKGTYIGLNGGQVTQIEPGRVVIEEEIENIMGELVVQNTELKLQKPAGEL